MTGTNKPVQSRAMSPIHPRAAAIDVGAKMHVAAVGPDRASEPVRTFGTFTDDLNRLADWFQECGIETIAMESTGVYWIPVFEILEQRGFEVLLVNARDAKHVPGRKSAMPSGCSACTSSVSCAPASFPRARLPPCAHICASVRGLWSCRRRTSSTCRKP